MDFENGLIPQKSVLKHSHKSEISDFIFQHLIQGGIYKMMEKQKKGRQSTYLDEYIFLEKNPIKKY